MFFLEQHLASYSLPKEIPVSYTNETVLRSVFSLVFLSAGDPVVVVGYGGMGRRCGPSLTCGVLSKAISLKDQPVMLQTTCAVQAGASGGAVVQRRSGELLGKKQNHVLFLISGGHMKTTKHNAPHVCRKCIYTHLIAFSALLYLQF